MAHGELRKEMEELDRLKVSKEDVEFFFLEY